MAGMAEQDPAEPGREETSTRLRDRSWSVGNVVAACVAALLIGGVVGASLGALAVRGDDGHGMMRHPDRRAQPWPHEPSRGQQPGRQWQGMPGDPGGLSRQERQELREQMREFIRQWREERQQGTAPTPAPSPDAPKG